MSSHAPDTLSWVPPVGEAFGVARARLLVAWLKPRVGPVVEAATQALAARVPGVAIEARGYPVRELAPMVRSAEAEGIYVGVVAANAGGTIVMHHLRATFDGRIIWYA